MVLPPRFDDDETDAYAEHDALRFRRLRRRATETRDRHRLYRKMRRGVIKTFLYWRIYFYRRYSRREESIELNRRVRHRVRQALRQQHEIDAREYEEKLPYD